MSLGSRVSEFDSGTREQRRRYTEQKRRIEQLETLRRRKRLFSKGSQGPVRGRVQLSRGISLAEFLNKLVGLSYGKIQVGLPRSSPSAPDEIDCLVQVVNAKSQAECPPTRQPVASG
jgi:hypothetical protein